MEKKELFALLTNGLAPQVSTEFSAEDANVAAINALCEAAGLSADMSSYEIAQHEATAFAIISEAIDMILPKRLEKALGRFAEVKTYARDAEVVFNLNKVGKARARLSITKGARGGIYRAARLDTAHFTMEVETYTVAVFVTLEDILLGTYTLQELYQNILEGFEEKIYLEVVKALTDAKAVVGNFNNQKTFNSVTTFKTALDEAVPVVRQYGQAMILGFYSEISKLMNDVANITPAVNQKDLDEIRSVGHITMYKGTPVIELPNYLNDKNEFQLDEKVVFVIPTDAKPVKVAMKGNTVIVKNAQPSGSQKWEIHKLCGVGVAMNNNYFVLKDNAE